MATDFHFSIVINADCFDDALEIYGQVLNSRVRNDASAALSYRVGNETKILSRDNIKTGAGYAGLRAQIHTVQ